MTPDMCRLPLFLGGPVGFVLPDSSPVAAATQMTLWYPRITIGSRVSRLDKQTRGFAAEERWNLIDFDSGQIATQVEHDVS